MVAAAIAVENRVGDLSHSLPIRHVHDTPPGRAQREEHRGRFVRSIANDDDDSLGDEPLGDGPADAAGAAEDDGHILSESEIHVPSPSESNCVQA